MVLAWNHKVVARKPPKARKGEPTPESTLSPSLETWYTQGGDAMAVITRKPNGYELIAWWVSKVRPDHEPLTDDNPPIFSSLEEAQEEAERLIFARNTDWSRLLAEP